MKTPTAIVLLDKFVPDGLHHRPDEGRSQQGSDHDGQARGDRPTLWAELPADALVGCADSAEIPKDMDVKAKPRRLNIAMWKAGRRADSA
jgi:hypothetical protein